MMTDCERDTWSAILRLYRIRHLVPNACLETLDVTKWSMKNDTAPSATALFLTECGDMGVSTTETLAVSIDLVIHVAVRPTKIKA
jgi:hypothetical protein